MAKLFVLIALCVAGAVAVPSQHSEAAITLSAHHALAPMSRIAESLKVVDGNLAACLETLKEQLLESFVRNGLAARACVADCVDEVMVIHDDVWNSWVAAAAVVEKQIEAFHACNNVACKLLVVKEIKKIAVQNVHDVTAIIVDGVKAISLVYPEAYTCTKQVFIDLFVEQRKIVHDFVICVKA